MSPSQADSPTAGRGFPARPREGVISGYVLRCIREQIGFTQEQLAEYLGVALDTVAAWESGRRALTSIPVGQMLMHRNRFLAAGAAADLLAALERAMEADVLLGGVLNAPNTAPEHQPLGSQVLQRNVVELLIWPIDGTAPKEFSNLPSLRRRRGPTPVGPEVPAPARTAFFNHLRTMAEQARSADDVLTRRQALYLLSYDPAPDAVAWLRDQQREYASHGWLPDWLNARSVASVEARQGDRDRMTHFITHTLLDSDAGETANLNYWAYWVGESRRVQSNDLFLREEDPGAWGGSGLLTHFSDHLKPGLGFLDLYVHSLWSLIAVRPHLLRGQRVELEDLRQRVEILLDSEEPSAQSGRELDAVRYAIRLAKA